MIHHHLCITGLAMADVPEEQNQAEEAERYARYGEDHEEEEEEFVVTDGIIGHGYRLALLLYYQREDNHLYFEVHCNNAHHLFWLHTCND